MAKRSEHGCASKRGRESSKRSYTTCKCGAWILTDRVVKSPHCAQRGLPWQSQGKDVPALPVQPKGNIPLWRQGGAEPEPHQKASEARKRREREHVSENETWSKWHAKVKKVEPTQNVESPTAPKAATVPMEPKLSRSRRTTPSASDSEEFGSNAAERRQQQSNVAGSVSPPAQRNSKSESRAQSESSAASERRKRHRSTSPPVARAMSYSYSYSPEAERCNSWQKISTHLQRCKELARLEVQRTWTEQWWAQLRLIERATAQLHQCKPQVVQQ